jgi:hypothetical protein
MHNVSAIYRNTTKYCTESLTYYTHCNYNSLKVATKASTSLIPKPATGHDPTASLLTSQSNNLFP